jgi:hypothetical protein
MKRNQIKRIDGEIRRVCYINDSLEEVLKIKNKLKFQFYEKLPPHALAVQEWLDGKIIEIQINNTTMSV